MQIMRTYHILILELVDPEVSFIGDIPDIDLKSQKHVWKIKKIINLKLINNGERKYLVK